MILFFFLGGGVFFVDFSAHSFIEGLIVHQSVVM